MTILQLLFAIDIFAAQFAKVSYDTFAIDIDT
jgi:hypothetical protein